MTRIPKRAFCFGRFKIVSVRQKTRVDYECDLHDWKSCKLGPFGALQNNAGFFLRRDLENPKYSEIEVLYHVSNHKRKWRCRLMLGNMLKFGYLPHAVNLFCISNHESINMLADISKNAIWKHETPEYICSQYAARLVQGFKHTRID